MSHGTPVPEQWRPVPGHSGYEVSSHGRVRSYRNRQGHPVAEPRLMSPGRRQDGYRVIKLGRHHQTGVHILVLTSFVGPRPAPDMECRHLDGNRANNHLGNLRWGTRSENYDDRRGHGTTNDGERHGNARLSNAQVKEIRASTASIRDLASRYSVSPITIGKITSGASWQGIEGAPIYVPGRRRGERNGRAKLSERQVLEIRTSTLPRRTLAERYRVSRSTIRQIQTRQGWKHLP